MATYLIRRLLLIPPTLFFILLVNFVIINLAPGDPTTVTDISPEGGAVRKSSSTMAFGSDMRYLQFREFYGLTLPILLNTWPFLDQADVDKSLQRLDSRQEKGVEIPLKRYDAYRLELGDQARFIMPQLLSAMLNPANSESIRALASHFFVRGGTRQAIVNPQLSPEERAYNDLTALNNRYLMEHVKDIPALQSWFEKNAQSYGFLPTTGEKWHSLFFETRFFRYTKRVLTLDFGTMRNDSNKTVLSEVTKRIKYSLTLSVLPMFLTFFLCQLFGFYMAYFQNGLSDRFLNVVFLILYAIPVFVVAPFLIEKIALHHTFPWNGEPIPISGFSSPEAIYEQQTSWERLKDILQHLMLPFVAVMYGSLAAQTRLSRTAVLEVMRQDYVRTAKAKGLSTWEILFKHVGRNAGITIITSLAASLGTILGGALIVETLFEINGFGKFFYDAIVNRDFNVILFSAIAGSFLALLGYVVADLFYMLLDPRVTLEKET